MINRVITPKPVTRTVTSSRVLAADYGSKYYFIDCASPGNYQDSTIITEETSQILGVRSLDQAPGYVAGLARKSGKVYIFNQDGNYISHNFALGVAPPGGRIQGPIHRLHLPFWSPPASDYFPTMNGLTGATGTITIPGGFSSFPDTLVSRENPDEFLLQRWNDKRAYYTANNGASYSEAGTTKYRGYWNGFFNGLKVHSRDSESTVYYDLSAGSWSPLSLSDPYYSAGWQADTGDILWFSKNFDSAPDNLIYKLTTAGISPVTVGADFSVVSRKVVIVDRWDANRVFVVTSGEGGNSYVRMSFDGGLTWTLSNAAPKDITGLRYNQLTVTSDGNYIAISNFASSSEIFIYNVVNNSWATFTCESNARYVDAF